jgi:hypothetical protein
MFRSLFLLVSAFQATSATIQNCGKDTSLFQLTELSLTPDPPVKGQSVKLSVTFQNPGFSVVSGTSKTSASLNFVPVPDTIQPLCASTTCPLEMRQNERHTTTTWPDTLTGLIKSKLEWFNDTNEQLLCIELQTKIAGSFLKYSSDEYNETDTTFLSTFMDLKSHSLWEPSTVDTTAYSLISDTLN